MVQNLTLSLSVVYLWTFAELMLQRGIIRPELVFQEEMVVKSFCHISSKALCEGIPTNIYAARIKFKSLMLAYRVLAGSAPGQPIR